MLKDFALRPVQQDMLPFLLSTPRCALWADMGTGKTSAILHLVRTLDVVEPSGDPVLVMAPLNVARDTWPDEQGRWRQFADLSVVPIIGQTPKARLKQLEKRGRIYTCNYENAEWLVNTFGQKWPFKMVVADESDRLKGLRAKGGAVNAGAMARIAHHLTHRWINLTGTPSPNGLADLWGQTWYIDRGARLGRSYQAFTERWFMPAPGGYGVKPVKNAKEQIFKAVSDICMTIDAKDYYDLSEPIRNVLTVKLPPKARQIYTVLERDMLSHLESGERITALNAAALAMKCMQLANGAVYTEHPEWAPVHAAKLEALDSYMHEAGGEPVLVAYQFQSDLARILERFPQARYLKEGDNLAAFKRGEVAMGVAHPKSMGHGTDGLQYACRRLVRFGHNWDLGQRDQMSARIGPVRQMQAGFDRAVYETDIVCEDTVDEDMLERHASKREVQDLLLASAKRRRT